MYIHQRPNWPHLDWRNDELTSKVAIVRQLPSMFLHRVESFDPPVLREIVLDNLTSLVLKSSEMKGPNLDKKRVRSAIAYRLGWGDGAPPSANPRVDGIVDLMLDATQNYAEPLTVERVFRWHSGLLSSEVIGATSITVGDWRDDRCGPKQVVRLGPDGQYVVDYEAPSAARINQEMEMFLDWFNRSDGTDMVLKAGLAHLKFVAIHPFDKGNGRIAWAIREMTLARFDDSSRRSYSMASRIRLDQKRYDGILKRTGEGTTDVTEWLSWFVECLERSLKCANEIVDRKIRKIRLRDRLSPFSINELQRKTLERLIDDGDHEFPERKWRNITKHRKDFDLPELNALVDLGLVARLPGKTKDARYKIVGVD